MSVVWNKQRERMGLSQELHSKDLGPYPLCTCVSANNRHLKIAGHVYTFLFGREQVYLFQERVVSDGQSEEFFPSRVRFVLSPQAVESVLEHCHAVTRLLGCQPLYHRSILKGKRKQIREKTGVRPEKEKETD